jgi:integrase
LRLQIPHKPLHQKLDINLPEGQHLVDRAALFAHESLRGRRASSLLPQHLGHSSIQTTATTYANVTPGGQSRAAELMPPLDLVQDGAKKSNKKG